MALTNVGGTTGGGGGGGTEETLILPPPSPLNPLPAVSVALRVDNREQLQSILFEPQHQPHHHQQQQSSNYGQSSVSSSGSPLSYPTHTSSTYHQQQQQRQLLVFSSTSLRTLILRQILSDPHHRQFQKKKNWDALLSFPILNASSTNIQQHQGGGSMPSSPQSSHHQASSSSSSMIIVGTRVLIQDDGTLNEDSTTEGADIVTYFLRPSSLTATQLVARQIRNSKKSLHHRLIYLPQPTALILKVLANLGIITTNNNNSNTGSSSNHHHPNVCIVKPSSLQLDLFPLETDVLSLEYDDCLREVCVEGTPSTVVQTCARACLKLQDVVGGKIPRIQAYGSLAEEVVRKFMAMTVDEYHHVLSSSSGGVGGGALSSGDPSAGAAADAISSSSYSKSPDVAAMVVMDRKVDWITPMLTPLTYEGLLDDVVGIDCGHLHIDVDVLIQDETTATDQNTTISASSDHTSGSTSKKTPKKETGTVSLGLNGSDSLYAEVRDQHVEKFGTFLQNQAKALKESHANFTQGTAKKDLNEIHQFVKQIPVFTQNLRSLTNHIHLAELIKHTTQEAVFREQWQLERSMLEGESCLDQIEELVASQYSPPIKLLRLLCLQSLCQGGIKSARYDALRRDIVQTYGYEYLFVLHNLEKAGLLSRREGLWVDTAVSPFTNLRNSLHLIHAEVDTVEPDDIAYVSSGYAPLSVRLIQTAVKGWKKGREDILRDIAGGSGGGGSGGIRLVDITQQHPPEDLTTALKRKPSGSLGELVASSSSASNNNDSSNSKKKPTLIVFYVGGVTYMELASLRFLSKRPTFPYHIVCMTTKVINGATLLHTLG